MARLVVLLGISVALLVAGLVLLVAVWSGARGEIPPDAVVLGNLAGVALLAWGMKFMVAATDERE